MNHKTIPFKSMMKLLIIALTSIIAGRAGTAYATGRDLDPALTFGFAAIAFISVILAFVIISPKLKEVSLKKFLTLVLPLSLMFFLVSGYVIVMTTGM